MLSLFKNAYQGLSREVWLLSLVMLINRAGTMVVAFLSLYLTDKLNFTVEQAGFVMMMFGVGSILGTLMGGKLTDTYGYFVVQFSSLFVGGMVFFLMNELQGFYPLCICTFFLSFIGEAYRPANMASIAHFSTPETYTRSVALIRLTINIGWAVGAALGGFLAARNYSLLFWADGLTNILAALLVFMYLRAKIERKAKLTAEEKSIISSESAYKDRPFLAFVFFTTCYAITFFSLFTVVPLFYQQVCQFTKEDIGILMAINGLGVAVIEMILIYKIEKKFTKLQFIVFGAILLVLNYIVFLFFTNYAWMVVGMSLATLSEMFAMPFMNAFSMGRAKDHNRGQYSGLYNLSWSFAQVSAPLIGTQVIAKYGFDTLWLVYGGISLIAVLGFNWLRNWAD